jgi:hypothetical protein
VSVLLAAGGLFVLEMAFAGRYGFHRDELYFLDCARHLQGGYVDQPVLIPLLARITLTLFGVSLLGLRVWSALAVAMTVIIAGLIARELGGGKTAQGAAAFAVAIMPALIAGGHILETSTLDAMFWAALALVALRVGRTGDCRWWLVGGLVLGIGLANKHSIGFFAAAVIAGAVLSGDRRLILNRWALAGGIIAACFAVPDLWWQAAHNWPTIEMTRVLNEENGGAGNIITFVVGQLLMVDLVFISLVAGGVRFLWCSGRHMTRGLVWAYGLLFVLFAVTSGAKIYYLAAAYVYLLAAGSVRAEAWWQARPRRFAARLVAAGVLTVVILPIVLPVLPADDAGTTESINAVLAEEIGWPELVHTVHHVWFSLPPAQRRHAVIFTGDYGEAGAINELGRGTGLPIAVSGHNNEWFFGPGKTHVSTVVAVQPGPMDVSPRWAYRYLARRFRHVRVAATLRNGAGVHNQEWGGHVYVCTGLRRPWLRLWPGLRQYS